MSSRRRRPALLRRRGRAGEIWPADITEQKYREHRRVERLFARLDKLERWQRRQRGLQ